MARDLCSALMPMRSNDSHRSTPKSSLSGLQNVQEVSKSFCHSMGRRYFCLHNSLRLTQVGRAGFEPAKAEPADLQSASSGTAASCRATATAGTDFSCRSRNGMESSLPREHKAPGSDSIGRNKNTQQMQQICIRFVIEKLTE